jgi:ATP-binding cassette subfamily B protein
LEYEPENPIDANLSGDISFEHVSFGYKTKDGNGAEVLRDISFTIKEGKTVALVGSSGGGKTTICHLLPRFYVCEEGRICIGGVDINTVLTSTLRDKIAVVAQDVFLFAGTVRDNILYGSPDKSEAEMIAAAKRANIHEYIMGLPKGYETEVGERGIKLSGGQKQRISIARAYIKKAPIMILDDSVSAVDTKTEEAILKNIKTLRKGQTTIVIASRVSTVASLDKILVLNKGEVEAFDTHENLLKTSKTYARMVYLQELEKEMEGGSN